MQLQKQYPIAQALEADVEMLLYSAPTERFQQPFPKEKRTNPRSCKFQEDSQKSTHRVRLISNANDRFCFQQDRRRKQILFIPQSPQLIFANLHRRTGPLQNCIHLKESMLPIYPFSLRSNICWSNLLSVHSRGLDYHQFTGEISSYIDGNLVRALTLNQTFPDDITTLDNYSSLVKTSC